MGSLRATVRAATLANLLVSRLLSGLVLQRMLNMSNIQKNNCENLSKYQLKIDLPHIFIHLVL